MVEVSSKRVYQTSIISCCTSLTL